TRQETDKNSWLDTGTYIYFADLLIKGNPLVYKQCHAWQNTAMTIGKQKNRHNSIIYRIYIYTLHYAYVFYQSCIYYIHYKPKKKMKVSTTMSSSYV
uniref:Uncharacterized protein n=1 Tax=Oryza brachyantha TaxID=4533 RepID=J3M610_ORYBR